MSVSPVAVPGHDNSAMDGYAVRFARPRAGSRNGSRAGRRIVRGQAQRAAVGAGQCVRIFTGGAMPQGADTVVMQERAHEEADAACPSRQARSGRQEQNRRFAGEDLKPGQLVFRAGDLVHPAQLGMMASLGIGEITVFRKLRVAFFSTGDELKSIGTPLGAGEIYDSNRYTIYGMLKRLDCELLDMGVVPDVPEALERAFAQAAAAADVVITSGGVSVGEADFVHDLLDKLGEVLFWKIAMKPGRPLAYGRIGSAHFFGLPGNPVAVMVTFYEFVQDALRVLQGRRDIAPRPTFKVAARRPDQEGSGPHRVPARNIGAGRQRRIHRAHDRRPGLRASCRRCRAPTASSCCPRTPATARRASSSTCSCSKA